MTALSRNEIELLTPAERLSLIGDLWDSLADSQVPLSGAQADELDRRLQGFAEDQGSAITWQDLKAELSKRN
jgi:putative addiction module component (TIGR02574 family)